MANVPIRDRGKKDPDFRLCVCYGLFACFVLVHSRLLFLICLAIVASGLFEDDGHDPRKELDHSCVHSVLGWQVWFVADLVVAVMILFF